ncbi:hypothetical protein Aduo_015714 [Ancylostoma duodenale]
MSSGNVFTRGLSRISRRRKRRRNLAALEQGPSTTQTASVSTPDVEYLTQPAKSPLSPLKNPFLCYLDFVKPGVLCSSEKAAFIVAYTILEWGA